MAFRHAITKYGSNGKPVYPKKKGGVSKFKKDYPEVEIFDSRAEYEAWIKLSKDEKEGKINNLRMQIPFLLIEAQKWFNNVKNKPEVVRKCEYICDFMFERDGKTIVLDVKSWAQRKNKKNGKIEWKAYTDDVYKIKKKLFLSLYPQFIFEEL